MLSDTETLRIGNNNNGENDGLVAGHRHSCDGCEAINLIISLIYHKVLSVPDLEVVFRVF